jgi:cytochrome c peroxidase
MLNINSKTILFASLSLLSMSANAGNFYTPHITQKSPIHYINIDTEEGIKTAVPKARLGRAIFFDASLSNPAGQSCASCHNPKNAFTDPNKFSPTSGGVLPGLAGNRNSPTAMYAGFSPAFQWNEEDQVYMGGLFLDGREKTLEDQAKRPFLNHSEMANTSKAQVVDKVRAKYLKEFEYVYDKGALDDVDSAYDHIADAIASFERTPVFSPFTSKYDAYLAGKARLNEREMRGLKLFESESKGNCSACHISRPASDGTPPLFTDFTYDNLGVPRNPKNPFYKLAQANPAGYQWIDNGLGAALSLPSENGKFKVPTLRNIAVTSPYMHNGYFSDLKSVVDFYNTRDVKPGCNNIFTTELDANFKKCWPAAEVPDTVNHEELGNLKLNNQEVEDIVIFMQTLTDGWVQK